MRKGLGRVSVIYLLSARLLSMNAKKVRLSGHGQRLRVRTHGAWSDPIAGLTECCRASVALDKMLSESIRRARDAGRSWAEIGQVLGVVENAQSWPDVREGMARSRQVLWDRPFNSDD